MGMLMLMDDLLRMVGILRRSMHLGLAVQCMAVGRISSRVAKPRSVWVHHCSLRNLHAKT